MKLLILACLIGASVAHPSVHKRQAEDESTEASTDAPADATANDDTKDLGDLLNLVIDTLANKTGVFIDAVSAGGDLAVDTAEDTVTFITNVLYDKVETVGNIINAVADAGSDETTTSPASDDAAASDDAGSGDAAM